VHRSWHYELAHFLNHTYQKASFIIPFLVDIVSKNGNLLLSIPLPGDGMPDSDEIAFLGELADWQQVNSEAIKGTRPWSIYGEGPSTESKEIPSYQLSKIKFDHTDIRFTTKGETLYAIALGWPPDNQVLIKSLAIAAPHYERQIRKVELLGAKGDLKWARDAEWGNGTDTQPWVTSMWTQLNAAGIKSDLITVSNNPSQTLSQLEADLKLYPGLESIEAMNEWDINGGSGWVSTMLAKLPILHQAGVDLGLPVIGPSLVEASSFAQLGDISQYLTYGNVHDYQQLYNPETSGWGGGVDAEGNGYGSILWNIDMAHEYAPGLPVMSTETGYQTGTTGSVVPETVEGTYAPRIYLARFRRGMPRTYAYELLDDPNGWATWGLLRFDLSPKPAFTAITNLLRLLKDGDNQFTPESLNYSLTGNLSGVETLLVQKNAGDFYLAVWLDGSIFDPNLLVTTPIAPQPLAFSIPASLIVSNVYSFNPDGTVTTTAVNRSSSTVNANSCVTLLHIVSASQTSAPVLSLPSGSYTSTQTLSLSDSTPGAQIFYTTNGSAPTANSTLYSGALTVAKTETVNAVAAVPGGSTSAIASATYTLNLTNRHARLAPQPVLHRSAQ
jgi:hypothetical protein